MVLSGILSFLGLHSFASPQVSPTLYRQSDTLQIQEVVITNGIEKEIVVPASIDTGDYHLLLRLTDKQGWQTVKAVSIKIR